MMNKSIILLSLFPLLTTIIMVTEANNDALMDEPFFEVKDLMLAEGEVAAYGLPLITVTARGTILVSSNARVGDRHDAGNVQYGVLLRSTDNGETWMKKKLDALPQGIVTDKETNKIMLFIPESSALLRPDGKRMNEKWAVENPPEEARAIWQYESIDDGISWEKGQNITPMLQKKKYTHVGGPNYASGIQLQYGKHKGRLILPGRTYTKNIFEFQYSRNTLIYSDDHGNTWKGGGLSQLACGEACAVELSDGSLYLNNRNEAGRVYRNKKNPDAVHLLNGRSATVRCYSISSDGGETFTEFGEIDEFIHATCHGGMARLTDRVYGNVLMFSNPGTTMGLNKATGERHHLTVWASMDEGKTWPITKVINEGPSAYSCMAVGIDGMIFVAFERGPENARTNTAVARFNLAWLMENVDSAGVK